MAKGCDHCGDNKELIKTNNTDISIDVFISAKHLIVLGDDNDGYNTSASVQINFCPICGRELKNEEV